MIDMQVIPSRILSWFRCVCYNRRIVNLNFWLHNGKQFSRSSVLVGRWNPFDLFIFIVIAIAKLSGMTLKALNLIAKKLIAH